MKGRNAIFFSVAVVFYSLFVLDVFVTAAPVDGDVTPDNDPDPTPDTFPDPVSVIDSGLDPAPAPDAGPDPAPDAGPEPAPDAGAPDADADSAPDDVVEGDIEKELESESGSESESDESESDESESDESESDESDESESSYESLSWMQEWQRRIVKLNQVVYRLQGENAKLQSEVYEYEKKLHSIQGLEASLSNEVDTWLKGMQFPGLAPVHDPIGIKSDHIINSVGEEVNDCNDALSKGHKKPGVYLLNLESPYNVRALCINGWTVVQRRFDGTENFNRDFDDYVSGFGNFSSEFILGLENLHRLTENKAYTLRIDVKGTTGKWYYGVYEDFSLSDEQDQYRLLLGNMTAGNFFDGFEDGRNEQFSTLDRDNDMWRGGNCAEHYGGGWWSNTCNSNLNQVWCQAGCLQWASKRVVSSIMRIKPSEAVVAEDVSENPNPGGLTLDETPA